MSCGIPVPSLLSLWLYVCSLHLGIQFAGGYHTDFWNDCVRSSDTVAYTPSHNNMPR